MSNNTGPVRKWLDETRKMLTQLQQTADLTGLTIEQVADVYDAAAAIQKTGDTAVFEWRQAGKPVIQ